MDLWVVAAAAGAGYLAKNLQNLQSNEKETSVDESLLEPRNLLQQIRDKTCPLRRLARKRALKNANSSDSGSRMAFNTTDEVVKEDYNVIWLSSRERISEEMEFVNEDCSPFELGKFKLLENRLSGQFIKPLSSLRNGLALRLYDERQKVEQFVDNSFPMVPLLISEGSEMISRSNSIIIPFDICSNGSSSSKSKDIVKSNPFLDKTSCSTQRVSAKASDFPGSSNLMLLFMIGITIGFISTIVANENKVTNLNEQLKQANNLVQDLEEELEMKDKLNLKDVEDEDENSPSKTTEDHPLFKSEIEAELEAELERLESNINTSILDRTSESTETPPPDDYEVSPRELAICLHELIESRLELRIQELETAIRNSREKLQSLELEFITCRDIASAPQSPASV